MCAVAGVKSKDAKLDADMKIIYIWFSSSSSWLYCSAWERQSDGNGNSLSEGTTSKDLRSLILTREKMRMEKRVKDLDTLHSNGIKATATARANDDDEQMAGPTNALHIFNHPI